MLSPASFATVCAIFSEEVSSTKIAGIENLLMVLMRLVMSVADGSARVEPPGITVPIMLKL